MEDGENEVGEPTLVFRALEMEQFVEQLGEDVRALKSTLELQKRAVCMLLALMTGQPVMTDEIKGLLDELGFVPISPLLVPATGMPRAGQ